MVTIDYYRLTVNYPRQKVRQPYPLPRKKNAFLVEILSTTTSTSTTTTTGTTTSFVPVSFICIRSEVWSVPSIIDEIGNIPLLQSEEWTCPTIANEKWVL